MRPIHFLYILLAGGFSLLAACSFAPAPLAGEFPPVTADQAGSQHVGQAVRWGGVIIATRPDNAETCLEILSRPLDSSLRPINSDRSQGRFVACKPEFLDPEVFARGREVSITGELTRLDTRKVGEFDYRYPILETDVLYLWPERPDVVYREPAFYYWPGFNPHFYHYRRW